VKQLEPKDPDYPRLLCHLEEPPTIHVSAPLRDGRAVAIVGSRGAPDGARDFAFSLAYHLAKAGIIVVSGGATGIDQAAHEGALGSGVTWLVSPTGSNHIFPEGSEALHERIKRAPGSRIIWPFDEHVRMDQETPRYRNGVLVALSECLVIVCAKLRSGSRNAASWARRLGRPIFVVPGTPWDFQHHGTLQELVDGGRPLFSVTDFFVEWSLPPPDMNDRRGNRGGRPPPFEPRRRRRLVQPQTFSDRPRFPVDMKAWSDDEKVVFSAVSRAPTQQDEIVLRAGLPASSTLTALLTLSLKDVVVEGPDGFFRSRDYL
jgi:DNA processing protein